PTPCGGRGAQSEGFGFASQGTWICPTRSRHSAGIGAPDSSRRYQSWTWSTLTSRPEIVTMRALRTFAAASAATWFSKMAAYGVKPRLHTGHASTSDGTRDPQSGHGRVEEDIAAKRTPQTHSVDCSETNRPHVGHWYRRTESSFSLGRPRTDVVASLTWRRSSTISRRERFGRAEAAFGADVVRGRDLRSLP